MAKRRKRKDAEAEDATLALAAEASPGTPASGSDEGEEVDWAVDDDGRYVFVDQGVTYVLAKDGYAYAEDALEGREVEYAPGHAPAADATTELPEAPAEAAAPVESSQPAPAAASVAARPSASPSLEEPVRVKARAGRASKAEITEETPVLLSLTDLKSGYGSLPVLHGVSVDVRRGETAVLLGLNGAGKTTTALNVCGALKAWGGTIEFDGQDITDWNTAKCVKAGVVMVPEGRRVFPDLSVEKNLQMGAWSQRDDDGWFEQGRENVYEYFPRMRERASQLAGTLSGGEQQMLAIGRGLMARPKLLIIDEASMGLAPVIVQDVFDIVSQINADGVTVLLIEQNVGALDVADLGLVMEQGRMVKQLRGERLKDRREVTEVLMG